MWVIHRLSHGFEMLQALIGRSSYPRKVLHREDSILVEGDHMDDGMVDGMESHEEGMDSTQGHGRGEVAHGEDTTCNHEDGEYIRKQDEGRLHILAVGGASRKEREAVVRHRAFS